jgi:hypothetical protein
MLEDLPWSAKQDEKFRFNFWFWNLSRLSLVLMSQIHQFLTHFGRNVPTVVEIGTM